LRFVAKGLFRGEREPIPLDFDAFAQATLVCCLVVVVVLFEILLP
jgi:hypothetical protein